MTFGALLFMLFTSIGISALITVFSYTLAIKVFTDEHLFLLGANSYYEEYTVSQRLFCILLHGRVLPRIVIVITLFGLYHGAQFLGNDLMVGWYLFQWMLTQ